MNLCLKVLVSCIGLFGFCFLSRENQSADPKQQAENGAKKEFEDSNEDILLFARCFNRRLCMYVCMYVCMYTYIRTNSSKPHQAVPNRIAAHKTHTPHYVCIYIYVCVHESTFVYTCMYASALVSMLTRCTVAYKQRNSSKEPIIRSRNNGTKAHTMYL